MRPCSLALACRSLCATVHRPPCHVNTRLPSARRQSPPAARVVRGDAQTDWRAALATLLSPQVNQVVDGTQRPCCGSFKMGIQ